MFPGCYGDGKLKIETCSACGYATGHAGYGEDSIGYVDGTIGPLCNECNQRLRAEIDCENEEVATLTQQLAEANAEIERLRALLREVCWSENESRSCLGDNLFDLVKKAGGR